MYVYEGESDGDRNVGKTMKQGREWGVWGAESLFLTEGSGRAS